MAKKEELRERGGRRAETTQTGGPAFHPEPGEFWSGLQFPLDTADLWEYARSRGTSGVFLERIRDLPSRVYDSMEEFRQDFGDDLENYGAKNELSVRTEAEYEQDVEKE